MVCKVCRTAGDANRDAVVLYKEGSINYTNLIAEAARLHDLCVAHVQDKTQCDCMHKVGGWVQR